MTKIDYLSTVELLKKENAELHKKVHNQALKIERLETALEEKRQEENKEFKEKKTSSIDEIEFYRIELERFIYSISHDLQEPTRTVKNFADLLAKTEAEKLEKDSIEFLGYIVENSKRMSALINALLDYSRIGRNATLEKINSKNSLGNAQDSLRLLMEESDINLEIGQLPHLFAYRREFKLLFFHLLENAIKFRKSDVTLRIVIKAVEEEGFWKFSIKDNGIGISKSKLTDIFLFFRQLHLRNAYEGTGIGLAHCKKIVELHGGKIWATSELGVGTTFYFTIPIV